MVLIAGLPRLGRFCGLGVPRRSSSRVYIFFALVACALLLSLSWDASPFPSVTWGLLEPCAGREHADCFHALYPRRLPAISRHQSSEDVDEDDDDDTVKPVFSPRLKQVIAPDGAASNHFNKRLFHSLWRRFWIQVSRCLDRTGLTWRWRYSRDAHDRTLSRHQCRKAFPGLFDELLRSKQQYEKYHTNLDDLEDIEIQDGRVRVAVLDGRVGQPICSWVKGIQVLTSSIDLKLRVTKSNLLAEKSRVAAVATLQSIQQSIIDAPKQDIPNIEFVFDVRGQVADVTKPVWVLDRREQDDKVWLTPFIGSLEASNTSSSGRQMKRDGSQAKYTFKSLAQIASEIDSQGSQGSSGRNGKRDETKDAGDSDDWGAFLLTSSPPRPDMTAPDVCRHKIFLHPDSQSTFNRLDSLLCASVNVVKRPQWIHLYHGLMYSKPMTGSRSSLPDFQNVMLVDKSGPDLEKGTPGFLRNTEVARAMASNAVETFRHRYLTEASTACYWRELIHTYSEVTFSPEVYDETGSRRESP
ncbi:hypothetical protein PG997_001539 [Apiospora hydei]|uniref:Glycosyltransferase family 90 protein n=1 Tax=Apiospora hydei TaxID=1337664 RepID=A0ABR1XDW5_9PEZI